MLSGTDRFSGIDRSSTVWELIHLIKEFAGPLGEVCSDLEKQGHTEVNGEKIVLDAMLWTTSYFGNMEGGLSEREIWHALGIFQPIFEGLRSLGFPTRDTLARLVREAMMKINSDELLVAPLLIRYLETYDDTHGTSVANLAKGMLFQVATDMCKADGTISPKEQQALVELKHILYDSKSSPLSVGKDKPLGQTPGRHADSQYEVSRTEASTAAAPAANATSDFNVALQELNALIGLEDVKRDVHQLVNFLKIQKVRQSKGLPTPAMSRHLVFYGKPGTGKTTIARLLAKIYLSLGILRKGHLVETDRAGLVAGFLGQTALKVRDVVNSAIGGILFIDEAYTLASENGPDQYGQEAIETLLKMMEDNRDHLIVIVAGYTEKMKAFLSSNPGLGSRFNTYFEFEDYAPEELVEIYESFCSQSSYKVDQSAKATLLQLFSTLYQVRGETFGNARLARNVFEKSINNQANRLVLLSETSVETLSEMTDVDIPKSVDLQAVQ